MGQTLSDRQKGRIVAFSGDTRPCENVKRLAEKADVLIHEATFAKGDRELAGDYYHSTSEQAAETAREACAKTDFNPYQCKIPGENVLELVDEAKAIFPDTVAAFDFYEHEIKRT